MSFPRAIDFYVGSPSVVQGNSLQVFVHADPVNGVAPNLQLDIFRIESGDVHISGFPITLTSVQAQVTQASPYRYGAGWSSTYTLITQTGGIAWPQGLYKAILTRPSDQLQTVTYFVIRSATNGSVSSVLYLWPFSTYQAYNPWGNRSLYAYQDLTPNQQPLSCEIPSLGNVYSSPYVSFLRPFYDINGIILRELPLIRWMYAQGIAVEHCTSLDLNNDSHVLDNYRLLVVAGHDEYWSTPMRQHVQDFLAASGNVAIFSGNTCWWQARFDTPSGDIRMSCYREVNNPTASPYPNEDCAFEPFYNDGSSRNNLVTIEWWRVPQTGTGSALTEDADPSTFNGNYPENLLTNVSFRFGFYGNGLDGNHPLPSQPSFTLQSGAYRHWAFANTQLSDAASFGAKGRVINWDGEMDGGSPNLGGTPAVFKKLALCTRPTDLKSDGSPFWVAESSVLSECTMGLTVKSGTVFTVSSNRWTNAFVPPQDPNAPPPPPLNGQADPTIQQITNNVLRRLSLRRAVMQLGQSVSKVVIRFADGGAMTTTSGADLTGDASVVSYDGADALMAILCTSSKVFAAYASGLITSSTDPTVLAGATVYAGTQGVVTWVPWGSGVLTLFDQGGVYYSPDGQNLGGGGFTTLVYSGSPAVTGLWVAGNAIYSSYSDDSCYRTTDPSNLRMTAVYLGSQSVVSIVGIPNVAASAVCVAFSGGGVYVQPDGLNLGTNRLLFEPPATITSMGAFQGGVMISLTDGNIYYSSDGATLSLRYQGGQYATMFQAFGQGILTVFSAGGVYWSPDGNNLGGGGSTIRVYFPK